MKKRAKRGRLAVFAVAAIAVIAAVCVFFSTKTRDGGEYPSEVLGLKIHTLIVPKDKENRPQIKRDIKYIVIHETGNTAAGTDAKAHAQLQESGGEGKTSWHYTVDENEGYHSIPDDEIAWHAGDGRDGEGNKNGIGVELCVNEDADFDKTFDNGAKLAGYLMNAYGVPAENIRQHFDFSGKNCPELIRANDTFGLFCEKAQKYADELKNQE